VPLGLPPQIKACLFDLDGVLTQTAKVHAEAWKQVFDPLLPPDHPFDPITDYDEYVDGKPREDGVRSFVTSRNITFTEDQVHELATRKDHVFLDLIHEHGVETYGSSIRYVQQAKAAGLKVAVVSSSKNTSEVLRAAKIDNLFDAQVDGNTVEREHLKGKPSPDTYLHAAHMLSTAPQEAAVFEDALAGVAAGRAGGFGLVVGIDRAGQSAALREHGADIVVNDLAELMQA
jgi:beta-phosphoglucomutase family hydrolase